MSSKKGRSAASSPAPKSAVAPAAAPTVPALSRGSMTANGRDSALQFLSARWKAVQAAANDTSLAANDKPEIHLEKAAVAVNPAASQVKAGGQSKGGSPWGRRH
ncbi:hypothetical protein CBS101457_002674 [Exobasidium rhododendri]|nr:hypothetical protein CBS101457_002674 [Exobasidium rhododendri]